MPKISSNESQYIIVEKSVEKSILHRSRENGQTSSASTSAHSLLYRTLKKTVTDKQAAITAPNYNPTNMNSDIEELRVLRKSFKKFSEKNRKRTVNNLEAERQRKLDEVRKLENVVHLGKEALNNIRVERKLTENLMQQTLGQFQAMRQQFEQTAAKSSDAIDDINKTVHSLIQELNS